MRSLTPRYPVDRYLVESSKKFEIVNIIDDDIWNTEPALKPEDEIILRKLHEMLQSTADDLKLLSGEMSKFHEPGVQIKTAPTPLDEEFNEKVHIEEIVNARFHGYKIIDKTLSNVPDKSRNVTADIKPTVNSQTPKINNVNIPPVNKKPITNRNLSITRAKVIQINGNENITKTEKLNNGKIVNAPTVAYNEYSYKYVEPKFKPPRKNLQVQEMPSISIRSELKEQKVLHLDILPEDKECEKSDTVTKNVSVVAMHHEIPTPHLPASTKTLPTKYNEIAQQVQSNKPNTIRKVSKMSSCDSSGSNNISSDTQIKLKTQKRILTSIKSSPKSSARSDRKKVINKKESEKRTRMNLDDWRHKLNSVYKPLNPKCKSQQTKNKTKVSPKKSNMSQNTSSKPNNLNNIEYIPYSKLTVGGVRASDIEREISDLSKNKDIPLSPILDKILSSRENSFSKNSPRKSKPKGSLNVLTTSDENLLQEVIDIERTVSETLSKNLKNVNKEPKGQNVSSDTDDAKENDSYADDFEDEKSDNTGQSVDQKSINSYTNYSNDDYKRPSDDDKHYTLDNNEHANNINRKDEEHVQSSSNGHNLTYTKISNLSFKNTVDIFEFVHSVDTQDSATQSNTVHKISPKETQTSPTADKNIQPIHNDLWPSIDPKGEVEKMFQMEKELIKKLIVEEYGDLLEKNIDKPSTSKEPEIRKNVSASQKNTQTSPAHVKHVMTSPTRTKTRTTSPFPNVTVDHHTSPLVFVTNEDDVNINIENENDAAISINLSSPRFSLRLPRTSREVLSNLGDSVPRNQTSRSSNVKKNNITSTSSSSLEADSSEISSLGEVKLKRKLMKHRFISDSESICSSSSKYSSDLQTGILPVRSEGEMTLGRNKKQPVHSKSEGEASFGLL